MHFNYIQKQYLPCLAESSRLCTKRVKVLEKGRIRTMSNWAKISASIEGSGKARTYPAASSPTWQRLPRGSYLLPTLLTVEFPTGRVKTPISLWILIPQSGRETNHSGLPGKMSVTEITISHFFPPMLPCLELEPQRRSWDLKLCVGGLLTENQNQETLNILGSHTLLHAHKTSTGRTHPQATLLPSATGHSCHKCHNHGNTMEIWLQADHQTYVPWSKVAIFGMVIPPLIGILIMGI